MRKAMATAAVGDDVYGDDPTVNELEAYAAELVGKEKALLVPSGTFGNQLSLLTWCPRGTEVILGEECHIIQHEAGAAALIAGVQTRTVGAPCGRMDPVAVETRIRGSDIHYPATSLICLENAHSSGRVVPLDDMDLVREVSLRRGVPVHLDGARLFNAAVALGVPACDIAARADSVMFCLSKGLCAPVGSMLAGSADFIDKARSRRKAMGGGMRQAGILAAAGLLALREMRERLAEDHKNARILAFALSRIRGITVDVPGVQINMVFFRVDPCRLPADAGDRLVEVMRERGILVNPGEDGSFRFVVHYWIDEARIAAVVAAFSQVLDEIEGRRQGACP